MTVSSSSLYIRGYNPVQEPVIPNADRGGVGEEVMGILHCQAAVVGSGPGGAITAYLLAEHGYDVVLLEEGPYLPLESCEPFTIGEMLQKYRCGGLNPAFGRPKIAF